MSPAGLATSDVIVVGAGSTGAALAGRLAERGVQVLLVEAGPDWRSEDPPPGVRVPSPDAFAWRVPAANPDLTWPGLTATRLTGGSPAPYLRGTGLGGTSSINGFVAIRPPLEEFDEWVAAGCTGWGSADVLPAFVRLEDDVNYGDRPYHGRGGPVPVTRRPESDWGAVDELLAEAGRSDGLPWAPDHNAPGAIGVSRTAVNVRLGVRVTTNDGYIEPHRDGDRLTVLCGALVDRVLIENGQAVGVRAFVDGEWTELRASQVVLTAGTAMTAPLLQRSGVGPAELLRPLGIPVVADLPVGMGMQDHVGYWVTILLRNGRTARTGARGNVTVRYTSQVEDPRVGDLLMISVNPTADDPSAGAIGVKLARCHARGSSRIRSADPHEPPHLELNLLGDDRDRALARESLRDTVRLLSTGPAGAAVERLWDRHGDPLPDPQDDHAVDRWLQRVCYDTAHLSGGARMGRPDDASTVVDPQGRVVGIDALTVADLSVAPWVPRANTHLTAVMLGERFADLLSG